MATVIQPAVDALRRRGTPYRGLLYAGLALTAAGIRVIEFNARFGDPETQVVLDRLATPLAPLLHAAATGDLAGSAPPQWRPGAAVMVVIAAEGYPDAPVRGDTIHITERDVVSAAGRRRAGDAYLLHAGTATGPAGELVSAGGRVLNAVGTGPDVAAARAAAYELAGTVKMRGGWYRRDIAAGPVTEHRPATGPAGRLRRLARLEPPLRVSTLELFFDLVFVFAITQLTGIVVPRRDGDGRVPGAADLRRAVVDVRRIRLAVQRPYPDAGHRTAADAVGMAGFLIVGLAIPQAFGRDGVALGIGYLIVVVVHAVLYQRVNRNIARVVPFNLAAGAAHHRRRGGQGLGRLRCCGPRRWPCWRCRR